MHKHTKKDEITCIKLSKETRDRLAEMGGKDDTFEDIIKDMMVESGSQGENPQDE